MTHDDQLILGQMPPYTLMEKAISCFTVYMEKCLSNDPPFDMDNTLLTLSGTGCRLPV
jgi:hypothetical protein